MIRLFFSALVSAFTIVGGVIGAGFITGKEIQVFFCEDLSLSGLYLTCLCFTLSIFLIMSFSFNDIAKRVLGTFISVANIVIAGCMFSALEKVYSHMFSNVKNIVLLQITTAIFVFFISSRGIGAVGKINVALIPIVIIVVVILGLKYTVPKTADLSPKTLKGVVNPIVYVGFNIILSFTVIKNSGEKLSPPFKLLSSFITALILCLLISIISVAIFFSSKNQDMPFVSLFENNVKLFIIIDIITLFAILTTYVSALYTAFDFGGIRLNLRWKTLLFLLTLSISNLGFSKIIDTVYPLIGAVGFLLLLIICLLLKIFQVMRRARTLRLLKHKE